MAGLGLRFQMCKNKILKYNKQQTVNRKGTEREKNTEMLSPVLINLIFSILPLVHISPSGVSRYAP